MSQAYPTLRSPLQEMSASGQPKNATLRLRWAAKQSGSFAPKAVSQLSSSRHHKQPSEKAPTIRDVHEMSWDQHILVGKQARYASGMNKDNVLTRIETPVSHEVHQTGHGFARVDRVE